MPAIDTKKSKIKMLVYIPQQAGNDIAIVRYNFTDKNKYPDDKLINDLKRRILDKKLGGNFRTAIFYNNLTGQEIQRITNDLRSENFRFDKATSKVKLVVYIRDVANQDKDICYIRYSPLSMNNKPFDAIIEHMQTSILSGLYLNKFRTALFYENSANKLLKIIYGK